MRCSIIVVGVSISVLIAGCSATPKSFYANPAKPGATSLCRTYFDTEDPKFRNDVGAELVRRGLTERECENRIAMETAALVGIAAVATGVAVAAACSNGCAGPGYRPMSAQLTDYDCQGGSGDGPHYVKGPVWVGADDLYRLDADGDGWGCEVSDRLRGA